MNKKLHVNYFRGSAAYLLVTFLLALALNACGGGVSPSGWNAWMDYSEIPKGIVTVILSDIWIYDDVKTWTMDRQP